MCWRKGARHNVSPMIRDDALAALEIARSTPCIAKKTFEIAREAGNDLIVQVKDNQPSLLRRLEDIATTTAPIAIDDSRNRARNCQEDRHVAVYLPGSALESGNRWSPPSCASFTG